MTRWKRVVVVVELDSMESIDGLFDKDIGPRPTESYLHKTDNCYRESLRCSDLKEGESQLPLRG